MRHRVGNVLKDQDYCESIGASPRNSVECGVPTTRRRLDGYGLVRLLQEGTTVPGIIRWRHGWMVSVRFDPLHPLAEALQQGFAALFRGRVRVGILR
jgi:hypothetical protein